MKKIYLSFLLTLFFLGKAFSACDFYGYYVKSSGFLCSDDPGQICIITSADWACHDGNWEVQITFPTPNFIYTDLAPDFSATTAGGNTTLHATLAPISEGTTYYCLEGLVQIPNTVFSVQIVSLDAPSIILNPSTFTIDVATTIGSAVGVPTVTQAVSQSLLLDYAISPNQGQRVIVDGTLEVNHNYEFGTFFNGGTINEIVMKPGSSIVVKNGYELKVFRSDIHGCEGKWNKILVEGGAVFSTTSSNIADGTTAVELLDLSSLNMLNSHLFRNDIGIGSFGANYKTLNLNIVPGFFLVGISSSITDGRQGFHFENVAPLTLSGDFLIRHMTEDGIYLDRTDLTVSRYRMNDCNTGIRQPTANTLLSVNDCGFAEDFFGIVSIGSGDLQVKNSDFETVTYGVGRGSAVPNEHTVIDGNSFIECDYDVIGLVQQSNAEVQYNEMQANQINVLVWAIDKGAHKWSVQHNENMLAGLLGTNGYNVDYLAVNNGRIFRNMQPYSSNFNFALNGGSKCFIGYNTNCISDNISIEANGSASANIYCNTIDTWNHGISILNNCGGSDIRGNEMTSAAENLAYGSMANSYANTGPQDYRGNIFDASSSSNIKAVNFSLQQIAMANQYKVGFFGGNQGSAYFPFFDSNFSSWFVKNENGVDYMCPPGAVDPAPGDEVVRSINANTSVLTAGLGMVYDVEKEFDAKLKLYRSLKELETIQPLTMEQQSWKNALSNSDAAKLIGFERAYQQALALTAGEQALLEQLPSEIAAANDDVLSQQYFVIAADGESYSINQDIKNKYNQAVAVREQKTAQLRNLLQQKQAQLQAALSGLRVILNSVSNSNLIQVQNLKTANNLLLNRITSTFEGFTVQELQQLSVIANQCAGNGGEGVYIARALLAESTMAPAAYNDECGGVQASEKSNNQTVSQPAAFTVAPNPAHHFAAVTFDPGCDPEYASLTDIYGKEIARKSAEGRRQVIFDTSDLVPGVYIVKTSGSDKIIKLVVGH